MSFWTLLDGGISMPEARTLRQRFALWVGRKLATRHPNVTVAPSARLSPDARICPRKGAIVIGENCTVAPGAIVQGNVRMGNNCSIQAGAILVGYGGPEDEQGRITLGDYVRIAPQVMMIAADHIFENSNAPIHGQGLKSAPITIEDDVWIAGRVNLIAGVTIGRGSVIGAGAVVTRDIPPYSIAAGVPARVIKRRRPQG